ncbi:MAG: ATP-binding cassette domain-containing protein, partial [Actinomycetota bacterium]|nr:ATP-binding cassette domain-containing protein [Actinomycetota bacterium]
MGFVDVNGITVTLPDSRVLLDDVGFRVGEGSTAALIGANGAVKSTLLRVVRGEQRADAGSVTVRGGLGVMAQFGLMRPFDLEIWYGERIAVLGSNGSGKSHFLRLLAAGGSDPEPEHRPAGDVAVAPVAHSGRARL